MNYVEKNKIKCRDDVCWNEFKWLVELIKMDDFYGFIVLDVLDMIVMVIIF